MNERSEMNKEELLKMDGMVQDLLIKRGHLSWKKFKNAKKSPRLEGQLAFLDFLQSQLCRAHIMHGDGFEMLDLLSDDQNLIDGAVFDANFENTFDKLYSPELNANQCWQHIMPSVISLKGERVGAGELFLSLVVKGWELQKSKSGKGDGSIGGKMREIKEEGGSLKPLSDHNHRIIDELVKTVFQGHRPGPLNESTKSQGQSWHKWLSWFNAQSNQREILTKFFSQLYKDHSVTDLVEQLMGVQDGQEFYNIVGQHVLRWYQQIDNWDSLIIIDKNTQKLTNIKDVNNLSMFPDLKFQWVTARSGDVRQHADGYVNIFNRPQSMVYRSILDDLLEETKQMQTRQEQIKKSQELNQQISSLSTFVQDPNDPLFPVWQRLPKEVKIEAHDIVLEMMQEGKANVEIATELVECFLV